ncbi:MAG TPA: DUF2189 domain-containing protein [Steroidobacteraceae bacterium]|nr:DUF2189 domain-containing protein [Steroidobacteraceae bacterium]
MNTILDWTMQHYPHIAVRRVALDRPGAWVRAGWDDLRHFGMASLGHGLLIAGLGAVLLIVGGTHPYFIAAAIFGYLLVGPIMTTGACELSRRRAAGEPVGFDESLQVIGRHARELFKFGGMLALAALIWFVASEAMLRSVTSPPWPQLWGGFLDTASAGQVLGYFASGAVLAVIVFAVSVVAVPLIIDRDATAEAAMWVSIKATFANPGAMLRWSALIVALTAFGFVTLLVGMIVVAPLLGHATWHAYRDLVGESS